VLLLSGGAFQFAAKHPEVADRIEELQAAAAKAALITPARVLEETGQIAFAKVLADPGNMSKITKEQAAALSIKKGALRDLGSYLGMSKEKVEHTGPGGGPLQAHVLLDVLLTPANLERLDDVEIAAIRSAAAKLALPAPGQVIEAVAQPIAQAVASRAAEAADAFPAGEPDDDEAAED
jgi:hypothetical protein